MQSPNLPPSPQPPQRPLPADGAARPVAPWADDSAFRANNFDALRFALATLVIFAHSYALTSVAGDAAEPLYKLTGGQRTFGGVAVDGFFIISGFLITQSWVRSRGVGDYLRKRVLRIYPGFIVAVLAGLLALAPLASPDARAVYASVKPARLVGQLAVLSDYHVPEAQRQAADENRAKGPDAAGAKPPTPDAKTVTTKGERVDAEAGDIAAGGAGRLGPVPAAFPANPNPGVINGSLWSIPYEFWCYIGVAALGLSTLLKDRRLVLAIFALALVGNAIFFASRWKPGGGMLAIVFGDPKLWARLLPCYLSGVVFYQWRDRIPFSWVLATACVLVLVAAGSSPRVLHTLMPVAHSRIELSVEALAKSTLGVAIPVAGAYLLFYLAYHPAIRLHRFARFGDFSYGLYLYAFPIQQAIVALTHNRLEPVPLFAAAFAATLVAAIVSWHAVEKPFLSLKRPRATLVRDPAATG